LTDIEQTIQADPLGEASSSITFQKDRALPILAAHFFHDIYTASVAPLLPVLIEKLSLSLTAAGSLNAIMQLPALLNPFIGYMADKVSVRYFVILAPAVTATLVSMIGVAPNYISIAILLFAAGVSTASFHAPAPAMIARVSGRRVGLGMSLFMASGEMGYTIGPLLAVWAVSAWTLEGFWRLMFLGWATSLILYGRLRKVSARPEKPGSLRLILPELPRLFAPLIILNLFRNPLVESITTYLPTYLTARGAGLWVGGSSLSLVDFAGVAGALTIGVMSDRLGRKKVLFISSLVTTLLALLFLRVQGWLMFPLLFALGFTSFSAMPVMLAIVQDQFPSNRAVANGLYMAVIFLIRPLGTLAVGFVGDRLGLSTAFGYAAAISFFTLPAILALPEPRPVT
jgi:FSR family fosmidomycin resistance protein-like MFS transporter